MLSSEIDFQITFKFGFFISLNRFESQNWFDVQAWTAYPGVLRRDSDWIRQDATKAELSLDLVKAVRTSFQKTKSDFAIVNHTICDRTLYQTEWQKLSQQPKKTFHSKLVNFLIKRFDSKIGFDEILVIWLDSFQVKLSARLLIECTTKRLISWVVWGWSSNIATRKRWPA